MDTSASRRHRPALAAAVSLVVLCGTVLGLAGPAAAAVPAVTRQPDGATVATGGSATFTADASSDSTVTVAWQSTATALPSGEPDATTWAPVAGATSATLTVANVALSAHGTFYRALFTNASGSTATQPAQLRLWPLLDPNGSVTVSGESYGPVTPNQPFSVSAPNAVVVGEPIVITGTGYRHPDGAQGSVATFLVDAGYSGDPNTLLTTRAVLNPVTGTTAPDKRLHAIVRAEPNGTWRAEIPWPDPTNTTRDAAFFAERWAPGSHHIVRILTGSTLTGDYQRGISVRFTVVDRPRTANESWVWAAYEDFLDREPTTAEEAATVARLDGGTSRATVARELATSDEWLEAIVTRFYLDTLGRAPDASGLAYWVGELRSGRKTVAQVAAGFYAAPEYYAGIGGGTPSSWVTDLYATLLERQPDADGLTYWTGRITAKGRTWVALQMFQSLESRRARVTGLYQALLGRAPDVAGRDYWAGRLTAEGDIALARSLAVSGEYLARAATRYP